MTVENKIVQIFCEINLRRAVILILQLSAVFARQKSAVIYIGLKQLIAITLVMSTANLK